MNNIKRAIEHVRLTHGLEGSEFTDTSVFYQLDNELLFALEAEEDGGIKYTFCDQKRFHELKLATQSGWYYHLGEFNETIDIDIKTACCNSSQWHRQQATWNQAESIRHADDAVAAAKRACIWATVAVVFAIVTGILNITSYLMR